MRWNRATLIGLGAALILFFAWIEYDSGIEVPFVKVTLTLLFIVVGFQVLLTLFGWKGKMRINGRDTVTFGQGEYRIVGPIEEKQAFGFSFGQGTLDFSHASASVLKDSVIELGVMFGHATIYYAKNRPLRITVQSILGDIRAPDGNSAFIGELTYRSPELQGGSRCIHLKVTVFCGKVTFVAGSLPYDQEEDHRRL